METGAERLGTFEELKCWQAARELRIFISKEIVGRLPGYEKFRLADQVIRAARSVSANIAEGYGRFHYRDNAKFCSNARGSCWEVLDHLLLAGDENFISEEVLKEGRRLVEITVKLINGYMRYLKKAG